MGRSAGRTRIIPPEGTRIAVEVQGADHVQLYGLSVEGAAIGLQFRGGAGHRLENVDLHDFGEAALLGRGAEISITASSVREVAGGTKGHGLEIEGGMYNVPNCCHSWFVTERQQSVYDRRPAFSERTSGSSRRRDRVESDRRAGPSAACPRTAPPTTTRSCCCA